MFTDRQREIIELLGKTEADFQPVQKTEAERIDELEAAIDALLKGDTE